MNMWSEKWENISKKIMNLAWCAVFCGICTLMTASLTGIITTFLVYKSQDVSAIRKTGQSLILLSSSISLILVGLYFAAARRNEPVGTVRPPISRLHSTCFILVRISLILWAAASIASIVMSLNASDCGGQSNQLCQVEKLDSAVLFLACFSTAVILLSFENCNEPFQTPSMFHIRVRVVCRVSYFDDILERSVSRTPSINCPRRPKIEGMSQNIYFDPSHRGLSKESMLPKDLSFTSTMIEGCHKPHVAMQCSPRADKAGYEDDYDEDLSSGDAQIGRDRFTKTLGLVDNECHCNPSSCGSSTVSSSNSNSSSQRSRRATPSSSVSRSSHRSPLSTVQSIDEPEVSPQVGTCFPPVPRAATACEMKILRPKTASAVSPLPNAHMGSFHRLSSSFIPPLPASEYSTRITSLRDRAVANSIRTPRQLPSMTKQKYIGKGKVGVYDKYCRVGKYEDVLDAHTRMIEESIQASVRARKVQDRRDIRQAASVRIARDGEHENFNPGSEVPSDNCETPGNNEDKGRESVKFGPRQRVAEKGPMLPELDLESGSWYEVRLSSMACEMTGVRVAPNFQEI